MNYFDSTSWIYIVISYLVLLALSLPIFCVWLGMQWLLVPFIPVFPIVIYVSFYIQRMIRKNLLTEKVKQNINSRTVVLVTNFKWYEIDFHINASPTHYEIKELVKYLINFKEDFSFYLKPTREDIEKVMADKKVREVYFVGHGNSSEFQINNTDSLKYKEFDDEKYFKDFVHQIHCGTKYGKPLRHYTVPKNNWRYCFFVRKTTNERVITNYFKKLNKQFN